YIRELGEQYWKHRVSSSNNNLSGISRWKLPPPVKTMAPSVQQEAVEEQQQQEVTTPTPAVSTSSESSSEVPATPSEGGEPAAAASLPRLQRPKKCFLHKKPRPHTCAKCRKYAEEMEVFNKSLIEMADPTRRAPSESTRSDEGDAAGVDVDGTGALIVVNEGPMYGLYPTLVQNIRSSDYFKKGLGEVTSVQEVVDEVERAAEHAEPYNVGALNIPSTLFCCLYKLCTLGTTPGDLRHMLGKRRDPYVVCLGLLYLRCVARPSTLWTWFYPILFDTTVFHPEQVTGEVEATEAMTLGRYAELLLLTHKYFTVNLNRLPEAVLQSYGVRCILLETEACRARAAEHPENATQLGVVGSYVFARSEESGGWDRGQITPGGDDTLGMVEVRVSETETRLAHWSTLRPCLDVAAARRAAEAEAFMKDENAARARKGALQAWRQQQREFANARAFRVYAGWQSRGVTDDIRDEELQQLPVAADGAADGEEKAPKKRRLVSKEYQQQQDAMLKRKYVDAAAAPQPGAGRKDHEEPDVAREPSPALVDFCAASSGAAGAAFSTLVMYPLDTVKTRLNVGVDENGEPYDKGTLDVLLRTVRSGGISALYRGLTAKLFHSVLQKFVYFYIYSAIIRVYESRRRAEGKLSVSANLALGYLAALGSVFVTTPVEIVQTRQQVGKSEGHFLRHLTQMALTEPTDLYAGLGSNIILCVNPAIEYTTFDQLKRPFLRGRSNLTSMEAFWLGALAKAVATVCTFPYVRVKVLQQTKGKSAEPSESSPKKLLRDMWNEEGGRLAGLYKGMSPQLYKGVLTAALMLMAKEKIDQ
ncbi:ADP/ATP carrier protein, partial [Perkinsus olseni]